MCEELEEQEEREGFPHLPLLLYPCLLRYPVFSSTFYSFYIPLLTPCFRSGLTGGITCHRVAMLCPEGLITVEVHTFFNVCFLFLEP